MAEIRYSGVPTKAVVGTGARLQDKWADFLGADVPMGLIKSIPTPSAMSAGGDRKMLMEVLRRLLEEEQKEAMAAGVLPPMPGGV